MKRRGILIFPLSLLVLVGSAWTIACQPKATTPEDKANVERLKKFTEANEKEVAAAMVTFEKRQQQVGEKKKAEANKADAKATPTPEPAKTK